MRGLSLCTGLAGLELGIALAMDDYRTVVYVENDAYCQRVIRARIVDDYLDDAPIYDDVATFPASEWCGHVDLISAGFPCQPWSMAGKRKGVSDERWIWPAIAGIIREIRPGYVFLENVPGLIAWRGMGTVLADLAAFGFDAEWTTLRASEVGASHRRERVFILARASWVVGNAHDPGCQQFGDERVQAFAQSRDESMADSESGGTEWSSREQFTTRSGTGRGSAVVADPHIARLQGREQSERGSSDEGAARTSSPTVADAACAPGLFPPGPTDLEGWRTVLERYPDVAPAIAIEPKVRGVAHGATPRFQRLHAIGNSVVPLQAAVAFRTLAARLGE